MSIAARLGLSVDHAELLNDSNKLSLRLRPCDVVARVADAEHQAAQFEIELAARLAAADCPVAGLAPGVEPRPYAHDGFVVTLLSLIHI